MANQKRKRYDGRMDEGRKRVIGIMAAILAARKLAQCDRVRMVPATVAAIGDAVHWAEEIMREIDRKYTVASYKVGLTHLQKSPPAMVVENHHFDLTAGVRLN